MRGLAIAIVAFVAAWTPTAVAQAAIGPQRVEALDRQGATEIIVRREPGLSAGERADLRAQADVSLTRRSTLTDTEVVRADQGELAEAIAELNQDPDVVYAEPVVTLSAQSADSSHWRRPSGPRSRCAARPRSRASSSRGPARRPSARVPRHPRAAPRSGCASRRS